MFTISVCDYDLVNRQGHWHPGAKVRFFRQEKDDLPRAKNGDLILLRDIKVYTINILTMHESFD